MAAPRTLLLACLALVLLGTACGGRRTAARIPTVPVPVQPGDIETGIASWYGDPYHGRQAASGEIFDKSQLTAAHLTLPFGTLVRVINLDNGRTVIVRITDRGPFVKSRIIDLSQAAAREIAMIGPGTARVRLEILSAPAHAPAALFAVQAGAFRERANAERLRQQLQSYGESFIQEYDSPQGRFYRVRVGPKSSLPEAHALQQALAAQLNDEPFVIRLN